MIKILIQESKRVALSNRQYHASGKPHWWVAWTIGNKGTLNFIEIEKVRGDSPLSVEVEVPDEAERVVVGIKNCGRKAIYDVKDYRPKPTPPPEEGFDPIALGM